jgi:transcriptional regulator of acetoin/glycerol metabolism
LRNPWVAIDVSTDPMAHARALSRVHERNLVDGALDDGTVREIVLASWQRSLAAGVVPDANGSAVVLGEDELEERRARSPLAPAVDAIFDTIANLDGNARHVVAVADADANLLWVRGEPQAVELAREMRFQEGASWAESAAGTNAVGTAVALDHAVQIFSAEHLIAAVHRWTCSAAPIHDPLTGELIGVVDLTADLRTAHPHTLSLAAMAAHAAEAKLLHDARKRLERSRRVRARAVPSDAAVAAATPSAAASGHSPSPSRQTLSLRLLGHRPLATLPDGGSEHGLRSLELLTVLAMHPEGLTAEQLALALFGEHGKTVTVRAQVHRVRARLGESLVETQPYRLAAPVVSDLAQVQRRLAAGDPSAALDHYTGVLLPASDAPAIVEARDLLDETVRRSVLTTADAGLLMRWLAHPSGRLDLAAARTLVAVLPGGDPRRAAATATVSAISRHVGGPVAAPAAALAIR